MERLIPQEDLLIPYFWVRGAEIEDVEDAFEAHPGVADMSLIDSVDDEFLLRAEWDGSYFGILSALAEANVSVLSGTGTSEGWDFEVRGESRGAIAEFRDLCREHDIAIEITAVHALLPVESDDFDLTDPQREALEAAFEAEGVKGVVLNINSPGGSPVQSDRVNRAIVRLREAHPDIPLYAVAGDVCASGAYYIAAAADRIYGNPSSLVGSIGVLMNGFGFTEAMGELGVERRLYTAGRNKSFLDPFSPTEERHVQHVNQMLDEIHQQFIERVKEGRGERLADQ
jgi:signal peptide peptidase SppA